MWNQLQEESSIAEGERHVFCRRGKAADIWPRKESETCPPVGRPTLPSPLLVTICLQALATLVLIHLETTLLFKITHSFAVLNLRKRRGERHKAYGL